MSILINFLPVLLFVTLYVGSGVYFSIIGTPNPFYQISPTVAIIPAIILGWVLRRESSKENLHHFLEGARHRDIITMCIIFLLAGAFSVVTKSIGSVDATANLGLSLVPPHFLLLGVFIASAFISTAIGTALGTIATIGPIAAGLGWQGAFPIELGMATVVGGSLFGDNLSIISDTTIAAVMSQEADLRKKLKINIIIAAIATAITIPILLSTDGQVVAETGREYSWILISPYIFLVTLAVMGVNVFVVLILSIIVAAIVGFVYVDYSIVKLSSDISTGFASMYDIMLLSILSGGLSGLISKGIADLGVRLSAAAKSESKKVGQLLIAKIVSVFDILIANNTVAIIFSGEIAREISKKYRIPKHYSAAWLDIFSCVFQGIIPYGAQILLASSIAGISPLSISPHVYYCYILGAVSIGYILMVNPKE